MGRISAVNALLGERGLEGRVRLPPLVVDTRCEREVLGHRAELEDSGDSFSESWSESEMDRRVKRGGRRRKARNQRPFYPPTVSSAKLLQHKTEQEEVKVQPAALLLHSYTV